MSISPPSIPYESSMFSAVTFGALLVAKEKLTFSAPVPCEDLLLAMDLLRLV